MNQFESFRKLELAYLLQMAETLTSALANDPEALQILSDLFELAMNPLTFSEIIETNNIRLLINRAFLAAAFKDE